MNSSSTQSKTYRKHFIPLESNPEVFTELVHNLGVSESLEFQDVLSLDDADVLAFLPRPVYALILVFPTTGAYEERVREEDNGLEPYLGNAVDGDVLFFKQTINNACGLYAILHAVCNGGVTAELTPDSIIDNIRRQTSLLGLDDCALALEADERLEQAYARVAQQGDTEAPVNPEEEVDFHYICFVKSTTNGHLYQLDGDRKQPISLGAMTSDEDMLSDNCLNVIGRMIASEGDNINFSLMALVSSINLDRECR